MSYIILNNLNFTPISESDFSLLFKWLNTSHVSEYWDNAKSLDEIKSKYRNKINSDWQQAFIVRKDGEPFGYIQSYRATKAGDGWWSNELETTVGIDQFIGDPNFLGKGFGTEMVREFSNWLLTFPENRKIITDPAPDNERAIKCYRKAGFKDVEQIDTPDRKALLMEKLAKCN